MGWRVEAAPDGREVQAWSSRRLPFDGEPLRDLRSALAAQCARLSAGPGEILHAVYSSADRSRVDLENVLLYNLHRQVPAARSGVLLERSYATAPDANDAHHHRYRVVSQDTTWAVWEEGDPLGRLRFVAPPELLSRDKPGPWWLAARRGGLQLSLADDAIVALDVRVVTGEPGLVTAEALEVRPRC